MTVYTVTNTNGLLSSVEFTPVPDGNFTFFHVNMPPHPEKKKGLQKPEDLQKLQADTRQWETLKKQRCEELKTWITSSEVGQKIVGEATTGGHPVFVTQGDKSKEALTAILEARGNKLEPFKPKIPFSEKAWQTGATLAFIGQMGQLTSGFLRPNRKIDWSLVMLAVPNLIATTWIMGYGAQRSEDENRLNFVKKRFNDKLDEYSSDLPGIDEDRYALRKEPEEASTVKDKVDGFLSRYSVVGGEILLRYLGAFSLAFAPNKWKDGIKALEKDGLAKAYQVGRTPSSLTHYAGLASLAGKTIALASKSPDPYNPEPKSWLDNIREKYTFRAGGLIEAAAFGAVAIDGFRNKKISFSRALDDKGRRIAGGGKIHTDFLSGVGGTLFFIRYLIRFWAPFGVKETDMKEMYAHVTDSLAKMPPDKLPQLVAESAAEITDHFKDLRLDYSRVYNRLVNDLYRYHHISLDNLGDEQPHTPETQPQPPLVTDTSRPVSPARKLTDRVTPATGSYADVVKAVASDNALGVRM